MIPDSHWSRRWMAYATSSFPPSPLQIPPLTSHPLSIIFPPGPWCLRIPSTKHPASIEHRCVKQDSGVRIGKTSSFLVWTCGTQNFQFVLWDCGPCRCPPPAVLEISSLDPQLHYLRCSLTTIHSELGLRLRFKRYARLPQVVATSSTHSSSPSGTYPSSLPPSRPPLTHPAPYSVLAMSDLVALRSYS
jgi:hypothetical protein